MNTFEIFTFINYLDFVEKQGFPHKKAQAAIKELFYRNVDRSNLFENCSKFVLAHIFSKKNQIKEKIPLEIQNLADKKLRKEIKKHLFGNKIDYTLLLHFEILCLCKILKINVDATSGGFWACFDYSDKKKAKIWNQIADFSQIKNQKVKSSFYDVINFISATKKYQNQKIFDIAVCATMSAGKSTFVNALLGNDYLPARNEATTAKITSVYDNDAQQKMIGFASDDGKRKIFEIEGDLDREKIDSWNSNPEVKNIYLQSDLDSISSGHVICAVHDTPGTNNSADGGHRKITMDFLTSKRLDMIIFVANATQLKTTDEKKLLDEIFENVVSKKNLPVLFVLNKADELDSEKEDLQVILENYRNYIEEIGFRNCEVLPVSAKAARLFKMALKGKAQNLTRREQTEFDIFYETFSELSFDAGIYSGSKSEEKIKIGNREYDSKAVETALKNTGIKRIENYISSKIK